jgi:hypothetical protein
VGLCKSYWQEDWEVNFKLIGLIICMVTDQCWYPANKSKHIQITMLFIFNLGLGKDDIKEIHKVTANRKTEDRGTAIIHGRIRHHSKVTASQRPLTPMLSMTGQESRWNAKAESSEREKL